LIRFALLAQGLRGARLAVGLLAARGVADCPRAVGWKPGVISDAY
jgi:hypothetical protein